ncbi:MAG: glycosyltransferase [Promethearchaeota archaeon]
MNIFDSIFNVVNEILIFLNKKEFLIILMLSIISYHIILFLIRDLKYLKSVKTNPDPDSINIDDLKEIPLINIIIPAWNEGDEFEKCLFSVTSLAYPKIKVIVNAGGNEKTIKIADSFKKYNHFVILRQKEVKSKIGKITNLGKLKAINKSLKHVTEGVVFFLDADSYITDEIVLRLLFPIVNYNEKVCVGAGTRPLISLENNDLVRYLQIVKEGFFRKIFTRDNKNLIGGSNTCISYEVIKSIGRFTEEGIIAEDISAGRDIISKGYKIYSLTSYQSRIYTDFPKSIRELIEQRKRYIQNSYIYAKIKKSKIKSIKLIALTLVSIYFIISPLFLFVNYGLFFIGVFIILFFYLRIIRRYIFFKLIIDKQYYKKFHKLLFIKIFYYIVIELIINVITCFSLITIRKNLKEYLKTNNE